MDLVKNYIDFKLYINSIHVNFYQNLSKTNFYINIKLETMILLQQHFFLNKMNLNMFFSFQ